MLDRIKRRLVDDWTNMARWWSVRWAALGAILLPALQVIPPALPPEMQALFPLALRATITGLWCLGYIALRVWAQGRPNG